MPLRCVARIHVVGELAVLDERAGIEQQVEPLAHGQLAEVALALHPLRAAHRQRLFAAAVELGWVQRTEPETRVGIDAPCGFIEAFVQWDGAHANGVRFVNVPSFIYRRDVTVTTPSFGEVTGDIAYGGAFYFYTSAQPHGLEIRESSIDTLKQFGAEVKAAANAAFPVVHPHIPEINHIYGTIIDGAPRHPGSTQANCCVFADREVDRSPTGSGTGGRVAQLYLRGKDRGEKLSPA